MTCEPASANYIRLPEIFAAVLLCLLLVLQAGAAEARSDNVRPPKKGDEYLWFLSGQQLSRLNSLDPGLVASLFSNKNTIVGSRSGSSLATQSLRKQGWRGRTRAQFESYSDFVAAVENRQLAPDTYAVVYNPETWSETPQQEQQDPISYTKRFRALARKLGLTFVIAPSCSLLRGPADEVSPVRFRCARDLLSSLALHADIIDLQFQGAQQNSRTYALLVNRAYAKVKAANPNIKVVAQLSTATFRNVAIHQLYCSAVSVAHIVDGYWLYIDNSQKSLEDARELLHLLKQQFDGRPPAIQCER